MPGLSALFDLDGEAVDAQRLTQMTAAHAAYGGLVTTRAAGPIGLGFYGFDAADAGERIVVEEAAGLWIVFVGQLYHTTTLADELGQAPASLGPHGTLVLDAYRRWGQACPSHLDGEFAFVLYDAPRRTLFCACDAIGNYQLFYGRDRRRFVVASRPRQLLAAGIGSTPCEETIADYLGLDLHLLGGRRTFYRDIERLEPGHTLTVSPHSHAQQRYWSLDAARRIDERTSAEIAGHVYTLLNEAVGERIPRRSQACAPAPYACALSGGLDSSAITGLMRRELDRRGVTAPLHTFSFEVRSPDADEPDLIRVVSDAYRTCHHPIYLDRDNAVRALPELIAACDQPIADLGLLYLWRKKEAARAQGVRCILSGLGGDELFYGAYQHLADLFRSLRWPTLWHEIRGIYPVNRITGRRTSLRKIGMFLFLPLIPRPLKQIGRRVLHGPTRGRPWIDREFLSRSGLPERMRQGPPRIYSDAYRQSCWEVFHYALIHGTLPLHAALGDTLGVETRFPMLDRRLVEYLFAVPREHKICQGEARMLQRLALQDVLPEPVIRQHLKKNMSPALWRQQRGYLESAFRPLFDGREPRCRPYFNWDCLRGMYQGFLSGRSEDMAAPILWRAINLELWLARNGS